MIRILPALAVCSAASAAAADAPRLSFPVDCTLGESCFIQNYFDRDPGPDYADFGCGALSYNTHDGTDIALQDLAAMEAGVPVFAAAPGVVSAVRDGMLDILPSEPGAPDLTNRNCGNAVLIDHGGGWETLYCHLRQGSVTVRKGDRVSAGTELGEVGLSGNTEFPHLHLELIKNGRSIDPFQPDGGTICGDTANAAWADGIEYVPGGLLAAGFAAEIPEFADVKAGAAHSGILPPDAPAIVMWVHLFGARTGDSLSFKIGGPGGELFRKSVLLERTQARVFRAVGLRNRSAWPPGVYTGVVRMLRGGSEIGALEATLVVPE